LPRFLFATLVNLFDQLGVGGNCLSSSTKRGKSAETRGRVMS
jgi:hypothetical protein